MWNVIRPSGRRRMLVIHTGRPPPSWLLLLGIVFGVKLSFELLGNGTRSGRVLGPRGLMPNPKVGTVTFDISKAVREVKAGKVEFRVERAGIVHAPVGKRSFESDKLKDNARALLDALLRAKPASAKGTYLRSITLSSTMGPGIRIDPASIEA